MATTEHFRDGGGTTFNFTFPILANSDLKVEIYNATTGVWDLKTENTSGQTDNDYTISNTNVVFNSATPAHPGSSILVGGNVHIYRTTNVDNPAAVYAAGSSIRAVDLNDNQTQVLYSSQEAANQKVRETDLKDSIITSAKIVDNTIVNADINANAEIAVSKLADGQARQLLQTDAAGTGVEWSNDIAIPGTLAVTGNVGLDSNLNVDGNTTLGGTLDVDGNTTLDGTTVDGILDVNGSATIDNITIDGNTITTSAGNLGIDSAGGTTIVNDQLNVTGNVDLDANLNVDGTTTLDGTTVDGVLDVNGSATIDAITIDGTSVSSSGWLSLNGSRIDLNANTDINLDGDLKVRPDGLTSKFSVLGGSNPVIYAYTNLKPGTTDSSISTYDLGASLARWNTVYADTISSNNITGTAVVTSGSSTSDTKVYSAKRAGEIFYEKGTLDDITSGNTWVSDDSKLATTAAIDARIIDLVDDVGGFVPIANELSFPNSNPDLNNGAGTLISIATLSQDLTSNSSGEIVIANGTVGNSTVFIVGAPASTTLESGFGLILETKDNTGGVANTYTFHRYVPNATSVTTVATNLTNLNIVAGAIGNVNSVGGNIDNVNSVHGNATNINAAVSNATNINAAVSNATNINTVAGISGNVTTVAGISSDVTTVANDGTDIGTVSTNIANVNTVAGISSNVTAVANNNSNVTAVAGNATNINAVASNASNINSAVSNSTNINSAVSNATNINTVAGIDTNVTTVAGISGNVTTVAGISSNVTTVANDQTDIGLVAGSIANVNTTAGDISNVNTVAGSISNVNTVGSNITNVTNASNYLNNFLSLYLGAQASAPIQDGLGNSVTEGDLYFNTGNKQLQIFNGDVFTSIVDTAIDFAKSATAAFNALYTASAGSNSIDLGGLSITGAAFTNEAIATNRISLTRGSATYNLGGI